MTSALVGIFGMLMLQALIGLAGRARPTTSQGRTTYGVILAGKMVFLAAIAILGGLPTLILLRGDDWRGAALFLPFFLLCVFALPGPIVVDDSTGLSTRRWYGRPTRIGWHQIARMDWTEDMQQTVIIGTSGQRIIHTSFHAGRTEFRRQVSTFARPPERVAR